ncbi:hydrogenase 4 subunit B [Oryzibacter oryziterrae]|uniref:hydrogenase 4 subunit B n=1 Tax=Oryzibacter oryziterrae TaxID=2766474 RepID=UPI001F00FB46|nr:hydrogenase 4 subunit B [Oryzibacter oryziterrae]
MAIAVALWCVIGLIAVSAAAPALAARPQPLGTRLVYGASLILTGLLLLIGIAALLGGADFQGQKVLPIGLPWIGAHFSLDSLSAVFLIIVNLGGVAASLYALGYGLHEEAPGRVLPFYPAFLAGMNLVLLSADAFSFLVSWEFMSLSSWALVMSHHHEGENRKAGYVYLLMASFGTLMLMLAFGLLAGTSGDATFAAIMTAAHPDWISGAVLVLMLLGAGSKAGLVPLHVWLPLAHPAAPSHVSGLMSGVMTKVAVYGFIRVVFVLLGQPQWWWAVLLLVLGSLTAVLGVLQAVMQRDLKRLLAYSTVENIGIIFIGIGLALAFKTNGMGAAASLAIVSALLHCFNHSLFKNLLFLGAGNVLVGTGERDIEKLGGLIHRMPRTAYLFLGGCVAISALPPLNGFVSEWLLLQAILLSPDLPQWALRFLVPAAGAMLALAAALAGSCFVRAFGVTFLGRARSTAASEAHEAEPVSLKAMSLLIGLCLLAGTLPGPLIDSLSPVTSFLVAGHMPTQPLMPLLSIIPINESRSSYSGILVFGFIMASSWIAIRVIHNFASRAVRRAPPWDCGFPNADPATQYTADSFAQPIRRVFGPMFFRLKVDAHMPRPGDPKPATLAVTLRDLVWDFLYAPISGWVMFAAERLNVLQFLTIRSYLSLVFAALVALLFLVATWA